MASFTSRHPPRRLFDIVPTGNQITVEGLSIDRMVDGKSEESWTFVDALGMMPQLAGSSPRSRGPKPKKPLAYHYSPRVCEGLGSKSPGSIWTCLTSDFREDFSVLKKSLSDRWVVPKQVQKHL